MTFEDRLDTARREKMGADRERAEAAARSHERTIRQAREDADIALTELREAVAALRRRRAASEGLLSSQDSPYSGVEAVRGRTPAPKHRWSRRNPAPPPPAFEGWRVVNATSGNEKVISLLIPLNGEASVRFNSEIRGPREPISAEAFAKLGVLRYVTDVGEGQLEPRELRAGDGIRAFISRLMTHLVQLPA